jgi:hypothetical protein
MKAFPIPISNVDHPLVESAVPVGALFTDNNTQLSDGDISAFGYIKTYTDTDTQLSDGDIAAFGYIKTYTDTDTVYDDTDIQAEVDLNTADRHEHLNPTVLDKFGEDVDGLPTYNGNTVDTVIAQRDVYDGLDSTDNTISLAANNGKILFDQQEAQQIEINNKVDAVEDFELVSVSHLIHQSRMDIMNFNFHMRSSLRDLDIILTSLETQ